MGLFDRFFAGEHLPSLPSTARIADVDTLHVRTAGELVICSCDLAGAAALIDAARAGEALQLRGPRRNVTFIPVKKLQKIVLDPNHGWIIPLTPDALREVAGLQVQPGEHMIGQLAVVVE